MLRAGFWFPSIWAGLNPAAAAVILVQAAAFGAQAPLAKMAFKV